jgi:hypothetical protein
MPRALNHLVSVGVVAEVEESEKIASSATPAPRTLSPLQPRQDE